MAKRAPILPTIPAGPVAPVAKTVPGVVRVYQRPDGRFERRRADGRFAPARERATRSDRF